VHLEFLAQSSLRVSVFVQWVWTYVTGQRGSQIILNSRPSEQAKTDADATILHR
jgi:NADH:ubiquinone reductase (H+-translocating)